MQASSKNLQVFLKERKAKSVHEMADLAEQYNEAHGTYESIRPKQHEVKLNLGNNSRERQVNPSSSYQMYQGKYCYNCKSPSHFIRETLSWILL